MRNKCPGEFELDIGYKRIFDYFRLHNSKEKDLIHGSECDNLSVAAPKPVSNDRREECMY